MASVKVFEKTENPELEIELPVERNDKGNDFIDYYDYIVYQKVSTFIN